MKLSVIVLFAVVAALVRADDARLEASAGRIAHLEKEIQDLRQEIAEAEKVDPLGFLQEMHARLDRIEDDKCSDHEVQCGWDSFECVSSLAVCDGVQDCYNGWDESEKVCSRGPMRAGNVFRGMAAWRACRNWLESKISIKITAVVTSKLYPSRLGVEAHTVMDVPDRDIHAEGNLQGYYVFGTKRLVMVPDKHNPEDADYAMICEFNHGDDDRADCKMVTDLGSEQECAEIHVSMSHKDTHHTIHYSGDHQHHDDHDVDHRGEIVEHHYDAAGHDHAEHFDKQHRRID